MSLLPSGAIETFGYDINNSLRFRKSASGYLNRTFTTPTNGKIWTLSLWLKRGSLGSVQSIMTAQSGGSEDSFAFLSADTIRLYFSAYSSTGLITNAVFRDPSAWYHIVLSVDTTQATASNRVKLYVNGTQQTFTGSDYPAQNATPYFNTALVHYLAYYANNATYTFDGYHAEINFIDGQALTPSSFGETDAVTGVWKAKKYTGTYGTNGFYLPFKNNTTSTHAGTFNGSNQYLSAPDNAVFSWGTGSFTIEGWIKTSTKTNYTCIVAKSNAGATDSFYVETDSGGYIHYGTNGGISLQGTKDVCDGNWHHFAVVRNGSTNLTLYIDGISNATGSDTNSVSSGFPLTIGYLSSSFPRYFNGQISNLRIVKGTAVYTSNFVPSSTALTAISNTSILTLQNATIIDNSTNAFTITNNGTVTTSTVTPFVANIASDNSGNNNNWFTNNINYTTAGTTYDAMTDSPTNTSATVANYCVLNPLDSGASFTPSDGNLRIVLGSSLARTTRATIGISSGKWYFETVAGGSGAMVGVATASASLGNYTGSDANGWSYYGTDGNKYTGGVNTAYGSTYTTNDVIGVALDMDSGKIWFSKNGTWQASGDPAAGTNAAYTTVSGNVFPVLSFANTGGTSHINFGQRPFTYTPPTGFKALNTYNLPDSTIKKGNSYMDATLWTGNGSSQTIVNQGQFRPDFVWIKNRTLGYGHILFDSIRGATNWLSSNDTLAEATTSNSLTSFNSNGFSIGDWVVNSNNGNSIVGWQWQAGSSTVTNTSGSISSQVRANTTAGFSIVTYTGTGSVATVGHGLGVAPRMIIVKSRSAGSTDWVVYHASLGATKNVRLQSTAVAATQTVMWNDTAPTSTVFTIGTNNNVNTNGQTQVAYCWAEIAGFSRFGSYVGNGAASGPFIYTGFRPKFVMIKNVDTIVVPDFGSWKIIDTSRDTFNGGNPKSLYANRYYEEGLRGNGSSDAYVEQCDLLSNGFKLGDVTSGSYDVETNQNGVTYIYVAFAENPFKNALAR